MNKLPNEVLKKIYEYDNTYHLVYKIVKNEFYKKTSFWRISRENNLTDIRNSLSFNSNFKTIDNITKFYNRYPNPNEVSMQFIGYNYTFCYNEFITDNNKINLLSKIKKKFNTI